MELTRAGATTVRRTGGSIAVTRYTLLPTVNFLIDPILRRFVPTTEFFMDSVKPPALVRLARPRNHAGKLMRLK